jgi:hypothetical protein
MEFRTSRFPRAQLPAVLRSEVRVRVNDQDSSLLWLGSRDIAMAWGLERASPVVRESAVSRDRRSRITGSTVFRQGTLFRQPASSGKTAVPVESFGLPVYSRGVVSEDSPLLREVLEMPALADVGRGRLKILGIVFDILRQHCEASTVCPHVGKCQCGIGDAELVVSHLAANRCQDPIGSNF